MTLMQHANRVSRSARFPAATMLVLSPGRALAAVGWTDFPMHYLRADGLAARPVVPLIWGLGGISMAVVVIISSLVLFGAVLRSGRQELHPAGGAGDVERPSSGLAWIGVGVGVSTVVLFGMMGWTAVTMARIARPPEDPALTIDIEAQQWWWGVRYESEDSARILQTANEIHIPVGKPVSFKLHSRDVIHSFWIPALGGKTDVIPGQTNFAWLQADRPGVYRGQCAEFCGQQHGHMGLVIVADTPEQFEAWYAAQIAPATIEPAAQDGRDRFVQRCGACHTVRGTAAGGALGPDLTHVMSRGSLAAATLPNKVAYLAGWIANPQTIKPGARMPNLGISGPELEQIRGFVETLK